MKGRWVDVSLELLGGTTGLQHRPKRRERRSVGMRRRKLVLGHVAGPTRVDEKESDRRRE